MTQNLVLTSVSRPEPDELDAAIRCFADDANNTDGEAVLNAGLSIIGEACTLLDEGKSEAETIAALGARGLSADCARPFVEKAREIVQSNGSPAIPSSAVSQGNAPQILVAAIMLVFALAFFFIGVG